MLTCSYIKVAVTQTMWNSLPALRRNLRTCVLTNIIGFHSHCHYACRLVDLCDGSVPIRRILKKYTVWVNAVFLWKKSYSVILSLRNIPSMHCSISQRFTYFTAFAPCAKNARKYSRVLARLTCRKISNLIQHTMNVATAQNYNSRKFGLKM